MLASTTNRRQSIAIITRRFRRRSTHGPSGIATTALAASPAAANNETSKGRACNARIATSGNASNASQVPNALTAYAPHSHRNCESHEPRRIRTTLTPRPLHRPRTRRARSGRAYSGRREHHDRLRRVVPVLEQGDHAAVRRERSHRAWPSGQRDPPPEGDLPGLLRREFPSAEGPGHGVGEREQRRPDPAGLGPRLQRPGPPPVEPPHPGPPEPPSPGSPERRQVTAAAQRLPQVPGERADVRAGGAVDLDVEQGTSARD